MQNILTPPPPPSTYYFFPPPLDVYLKFALDHLCNKGGSMSLAISFTGIFLFFMSSQSSLKKNSYLITSLLVGNSDTKNYFPVPNATLICVLVFNLSLGGIISLSYKILTTKLYWLGMKKGFQNILFE